MNEFSFIKSIQQHTYSQANLIKGVGDDAAVLRETNKDFVTAVDVFTEGVHFSRDTMSAYHIGHRALAANISDMAAMGAKPTSYLVALVIPEDWTFDELNKMYEGMRSLAKQYTIDLIGGDTVSGSQLTISITIFGSVERNKPRYRSLAQEDDVVFVTGTLGDSRAGFHILTHNQPYTKQNYFIEKHRLPRPPVDFALAVSSINRLAFNDISDGIANEAGEIAEASDVTIVLNDHAIPISTDFSQFTKEQQTEWKLFGGEDFELLGTVSKSNWGAVQEAAKKTNTKITKVGYVTVKDSHYVYLSNNNKKKTILEKDGYTHLSR